MLLTNVKRARDKFDALHVRILENFKRVHNDGTIDSESSSSESKDDEDDFVSDSSDSGHSSHSTTTTTATTSVYTETLTMKRTKLCLQ